MFASRPRCAGKPSSTALTSARRSAGIWWGEASAGDGSYSFGFQWTDTDTWNQGCLLEAPEDNRVFLDQLRAAGLGSGAIRSAIAFGDNRLVWHPAERNALGSPSVYFVSTTDCVARPVAEARALAFGPLLLRTLLEEELVAGLVSWQPEPTNLPAHLEVRRVGRGPDRHQGVLVVGGEKLEPSADPSAAEEDITPIVSWGCANRCRSP